MIPPPTNESVSVMPLPLDASPDTEPPSTRPAMPRDHWSAIQKSYPILKDPPPPRSPAVVFPCGSLTVRAANPTDAPKLNPPLGSGNHSIIGPMTPTLASFDALAEKVLPDMVKLTVGFDAWRKT